VIPCTQCGGAADFPAGTRFAACSFCGSSLYLDGSRSILHYVVAPTFTEKEAIGKLKRWMGGNETVRDLDTRCRVARCELSYVPLWRFVTGRDTQTVEPAAAFALGDLGEIPLSGGQLSLFSAEKHRGADLQAPDVLLGSAQAWLERRGVRPDELREVNLVHVPLYLFRYEFEGAEYSAAVEAASGRVLASVFPAKNEEPFVRLTVVGCAVFVVLGLAAPNAFVRVLLYLFAAPPLGVWALAVVRRH
jgi:hypothetical protein